jgi:phenylacetate-coenzyme A ligase PaaK-like adenylate-forming protein
MLIINGVNVFPSQIEEMIMKVPEVGTNYQIYLEKEGTLDKLIVKVEISGSKPLTSPISPKAHAAWYRTHLLGSLRAANKPLTALGSFISPKARAAMYRTPL